jgi:hypothetical protein
MDIRKPKDREEADLGSGLERLLAQVPPPKAPAWFAVKTLNRLRDEKDRGTVSSFWSFRWRWIWAAGTAALVAGWILWDKPRPGPEISDAMVFAALDALVEQEEENRWWAGL